MGVHIDEPRRNDQAGCIDFASPQGMIDLSDCDYSIIGDRHVGGCDDLYALDAAGGLDPLLKSGA